METFFNTIVTVYAALFPICNPLGVAPLFLTITRGDKSQRRRQQALKGAIFVFLILTAFLLGGSFILSFFGISLDGVHIAGGVVVTGIGLRLLYQPPDSARQSIETEEAMEKADISFSPLALPLLAGPGTIAVVMTKSSQFKFDFVLLSAAIVAILFLSITCWLILSQADRILQAIGVTGANILTKIMAFLLVCIGVQLLLSGAVHIFHNQLARSQQQRHAMLTTPYLPSFPGKRSYPPKEHTTNGLKRTARHVNSEIQHALIINRHQNAYKTMS